MDVARIEGLDQAFDRAPLPGGIPSLENDADGRAQLAAGKLPPVDQAKVQQAELRLLQPLGLLIL
jgi:hypothetical protein